MLYSISSTIEKTKYTTPSKLGTNGELFDARRFQRGPNIVRRFRSDIICMIRRSPCEICRILSKAKNKRFKMSSVMTVAFSGNMGYTNFNTGKEVIL